MTCDMSPFELEPSKSKALAVVAAARGVALEAPARADEAFGDWLLRTSETTPRLK